MAPTQYRPLTRNLHIWFLIDCLLLALSGIQLFILSDYTDSYFAWTIMPPLTAAFLGASYLGSLPLIFLSSRRKFWAGARLAVFGVLVFTIVTLIATLLHLDRFHLSSPEPLARFAAWVWLLIYVLVPPSLIVLTIQQLRIPGIDPPRTAPLAGWFRIALAAQAAIMLALGTILFLFPLAIPWPWTLTPLTGRAVAAWLIGIGVIVAHMVWENDYGRIRNGLLSYALVAALQFLALARYASTLNWSHPSTIIYIFFLAGMLVAGVVGIVLAKEDASDIAPLNI